MSGERRGRGRELKLVDWFHLRDWVSYRLAWGNADVIALKAGTGPPRLIQVKSTRRPYERFGPADRVALAAEAIKAGARAELCHWPLYQREPRFIPAEEWPSTPGIPAPVERVAA